MFGLSNHFEEEEVGAGFCQGVGLASVALFKRGERQKAAPLSG